MPTAKEIYQPILDQIRADGLFKTERTITTSQGVTIGTVEAGDVLNFCANNYLGLGKDEKLITAATQALQEYRFGLASVLTLGKILIKLSRLSLRWARSLKF